MNSYRKPLPVVDDFGRPFWEATRRREFRLPRCTRCRAFRIQFERWCPACSHDEYEWEALSGRGKVWSHCRFHKAYFPGFEDEMPYGVALVQLEEGPRIISNIVGIAQDSVTVEMPVEAVFDEVTPEVTLVKFKPAASA